MSDYLTNYDKTPQNIICGEIKKISITYCKFEIYNGDLNHPMHKYWFLLKNVKIIEQKEDYIKIAIANNDCFFTNYINALDEIIHKMICEMWESEYEKTKSLVTNKYSPITLKLNSFMKCSKYDEDNNRIENLTNYSNKTYSILIELSDIMIGDSKYWCDYTVKQLKINKSNEKSIFELLEESKIVTPPQMIQPIIPIVQHTHTHTQHIERKNTPKKPKLDEKPCFELSVNVLNDQINKMKIKKMQKEEEHMRVKIGNMLNEVKTFKHKNKKDSEKFKAIVASIENKSM